MLTHRRGFCLSNPPPGLLSIAPQVGGWLRRGFRRFWGYLTALLANSVNLTVADILQQVVFQ